MWILWRRLLVGEVAVLSVLHHGRGAVSRM
jgi:hypothetical protein